VVVAGASAGAGACAEVVLVAAGTGDGALLGASPVTGAARVEEGSAAV
jgi:hypothetical protein